MTTTTITPFVVGELKEVELTNDKGEKKKFFRKQILPTGKRKYDKDELDFSVINPAVVKAFNEGATDGVPFVFAMDDNTHPKKGEEIKKLEGDLEKLDLTDDGLYGYFTLSDEAKRVVKNSNGKFGVSGSIEVDYVRKDIGKSWDYALTHVCGTTGPHIKGMKPWETVELSDDEKKQITIDLSSEVISEVEKGDELVTVDIPKADYDKLMKFIKEVETIENETETEKVTEEKEKEKVEATLTEADKARDKRIELAETNARKGFELAEKAQIELAEARWNGKRAELVREGVPPVILTAAEKVLKFHKRPTITLTDNDGKQADVDVSGVIEEILDACKGVISLNEEDGHSYSDATGKTSGDKAYEDFEKDFFANFPQ